MFVHPAIMRPKTSSSLLFWTALVSKVYSESDCAPRPLSLAVTNVTLANGQVARGVELGVGTPSQSMAFLPQLYGLSSRDGFKTQASV